MAGWQLDIVTYTLPPTTTDPMKAFIQQAQLSPSSDQDTSDTVLGNSIGFVQGLGQRRRLLKVMKKEDKLDIKGANDLSGYSGG